MNSSNSGQNVFIYDRSSAKITGVCDVDSFSETELVATLDSSKIALEGENLKINGFNSEDKCLILSGNISGIYYFKETIGRKSIFSRGK